MELLRKNNTFVAANRLLPNFPCEKEISRCGIPRNQRDKPFTP